MSRSPRRQQWTDEARYHVMNRGHNREQIFGDDDDRRHFLLLLARYQKRFGLGGFAVSNLVLCFRSACALRIR